jgi:hypothetical protein
MALIKEYSVLWTVVFGILGIVLLATDRIIENNHLREEEGREKKKWLIPILQTFPDILEKGKGIFSNSF